jgi:hypothetical protein
MSNHETRIARLEQALKERDANRVIPIFCLNDPRAIETYRDTYKCDPLVLLTEDELRV